jgi:hypothetical protein
VGCFSTVPHRLFETEPRIRINPYSNINFSFLRLKHILIMAFALQFRVMQKGIGIFPA